MEAERIGLRLLQARVQTILFARSRLRTELLLTYLAEAYQQQGGDPTVVRGYRGGYLAAERREIEAQLFSGSLGGVVATSALELGIDVGDLDRVIQIDSPTTVASFLQRLGRTGRRPGTTRNMLFAQGLVSADGQPALRFSGIFKMGPLIGDGHDADPFGLLT